jgi:hypothetical protein
MAAPKSAVADTGATARSVPYQVNAKVQVGLVHLEHFFKLGNRLVAFGVGVLMANVTSGIGGEFVAVVGQQLHEFRVNE